LRHGVPRRDEGLRRRGPRRFRQLSARGRRRSLRGHSRILRRLPDQRVQGHDRVLRCDPAASAAGGVQVERQSLRGGRTLVKRSLVLIALALLVATAPLFLRDFYVSLLNMIGIYVLVVLGLTMLVGWTGL